MRRTQDWLQSWWLRIPEPRDISTAYATIYAGILLTGVVTLMSPPVTITESIGSVLMAAIGWFTVLGSALAMGAGYFENWLLERIGLVLMGTAIACYLGLILTAHFTSHGSRLTQFGFIMFGALGVLVIRYLMIRGYTYRPRG